MVSKFIPTFFLADLGISGTAGDDEESQTPDLNADQGFLEACRALAQADSYPLEGAADAGEEKAADQKPSDAAALRRRYRELFCNRPDDLWVPPQDAGQDAGAAGQISALLDVLGRYQAGQGPKQQDPSSGSSPASSNNLNAHGAYIAAVVFRFLWGLQGQVQNYDQLAPIVLRISVRDRGGDETGLIFEWRSGFFSPAKEALPDAASLLARSQELSLLGQSAYLRAVQAPDADQQLESIKAFHAAYDFRNSRRTLGLQLALANVIVFYRSLMSLPAVMDRMKCRPEAGAEDWFAAFFAALDDIPPVVAALYEDRLKDLLRDKTQSLVASASQPVLSQDWKNWLHTEQRAREDGQSYAAWLFPTQVLPAPAISRVAWLECILFAVQLLGESESESNGESNGEPEGESDVVELMQRAVLGAVAHGAETYASIITPMLAAAPQGPDDGEEATNDSSESSDCLKHLISSDVVVLQQPSSQDDTYRIECDERTKTLKVLRLGGQDDQDGQGILAGASGEASNVVAEFGPFGTLQCSESAAATPEVATEAEAATGTTQGAATPDAATESTPQTGLASPAASTPEATTILLVVGSHDDYADDRKIKLVQKRVAAWAGELQGGQTVSWSVRDFPSSSTSSTSKPSNTSSTSKTSSASNTSTTASSDEEAGKGDTMDGIPDVISRMIKEPGVEIFFPGEPRPRLTSHALLNVCIQPRVQPSKVKEDPKMNEDPNGKNTGQHTGGDDDEDGQGSIATSEATSLVYLEPRFLHVICLGSSGPRLTYSELGTGLAMVGAAEDSVEGERRMSGLPERAKTLAQAMKPGPTPRDMSTVLEGLVVSQDSQESSVKGEQPQQEVTGEVSPMGRRMLSSTIPGWPLFSDATDMVQSSGTGSSETELLAVDRKKLMELAFLNPDMASFDLWMRSTGSMQCSCQEAYAVFERICKANSACKRAAAPLPTALHHTSMPQLQALISLDVDALISVFKYVDLMYRIVPQLLGGKGEDAGQLNDALGAAVIYASRSCFQKSEEERQADSVYFGKPRHPDVPNMKCFHVYVTSELSIPFDEDAGEDADEDGSEEGGVPGGEDGAPGEEKEDGSEKGGVPGEEDEHEDVPRVEVVVPGVLEGSDVGDDEDVTALDLEWSAADVRKMLEFAASQQGGSVRNALLEALLFIVRLKVAGGRLQDDSDGGMSVLMRLLNNNVQDIRYDLRAVQQDLRFVLQDARHPFAVPDMLPGNCRNGTHPVLDRTMRLPQLWDGQPRSSLFKGVVDFQSDFRVPRGSESQETERFAFSSSTGPSTLTDLSRGTLRVQVQGVLRIPPRFKGDGFNGVYGDSPGAGHLLFRQARAARFYKSGDPVATLLLRIQQQGQQEQEEQGQRELMPAIDLLPASDAGVRRLLLSKNSEAKEVLAANSASFLGTLLSLESINKAMAPSVLGLQFGYMTSL